MWSWDSYFTCNSYTQVICPCFLFFSTNLPPSTTQGNLKLNTKIDMAPRLPASKLNFICDMIDSHSFSTSQMAEEAECSKLTIINIHRNLWQFGSIYAPQTQIGWKWTVMLQMTEALCHHLLEKSELYLDEMSVFLWDEFQTLITVSSIRSNNFRIKEVLFEKTLVIENLQIIRIRNSIIFEYSNIRYSISTPTLFF